MKKIIKIMAIAMAALTAFSLAACDSDAELYVEEGISVVFDYNDGVSRPYTVTVDESESVEEPTEPIRTGYSFSYWQTQPDGGVEVQFPYTPTTDTTLYAHWDAMICSVTFDFNYEGSTPYVSQTEYGSTVEAPSAPERKNYTLYAWRTQPDGGSTVTFPCVVTKNITYYAYWISSDTGIFNVTFNYNYPDAPESSSIEVLEGETITQKQAGSPSRLGYSFGGWATDPDGTAVVTFPYTPSSSGTLYAVWNVVQYTIAFRYNYVDSPSTFYERITADGGSSLEAPEIEPLRDGYSFAGWFTTAVGGTQIEFPITVVENKAFYAHWKTNPVVTDIFDAEFTEIDPSEKFYTYSAEDTGLDIIKRDDPVVKGAYSENYPTNSTLPTHYGYYVSSLTRQGKSLTFVINSSAAVSGVTLTASLALLSQFGTSWTFASTGDNAFAFYVNDVALTYSATVTGTFKEYTIATNVSLKAGENVIRLVVENDNTAFGGGLFGTAPEVDYIKLSNHGSATLSWSPVYDNIYR